MGLLTNIGSNLENFWNNDIAKPIQQGVGQLANNIQHPINVTPPSNPISQAGQQLGQNIMNAPLFHNYLGGLPQQGQPQFGPTIGQYAQGQVMKPIQQGVQSLFNPQSSLAQHAQGGAQIIGGLYGATPMGIAQNAVTGAAAGALRSARTGQNLNQSVTQATSNPTGIGTGGLGLKGPLGSAVDFASNFATPGNIGKVADLAKSGEAANMLKGISPNVFNMHPMDEKAALSLADTILNTKDKLSVSDQKDLQNLAEHYLGGKYVAGTNKQIAQAFQYALASKYNGIPGKLPNMGLVNGNATEAPMESAIPQANSLSKEPPIAGQPPTATQPIAQSPSLEGNVPQGATERKFITSVKDSNEVSPTVQGKVQGTYNPKSNDILKEQSGNLLGQGLDKATNNVLGALGQKHGTLSDQNVSDAIAVAKAHDDAGNFDQATQIYDKLAEHLTEAGRQVQAASLLSSRTPQGLLYSAQKTLKKVGIPFDGIIKDKVQELVDGIKQTAEGTPERQVATQQLMSFVNSNIPRSKIDAGLGIWRAGLLTGPETVAKVLVSHGVTTPFELASQIPAELHDRMLALVTGKRGVTATLQGGASGLATGLKASAIKLKSGIDMPHTGGFEQSMGSGTHQTPYENIINNIHGSLPKPAFNARYNISLHDQALTEATNKGLQGNERNAFVQDFVKKPSEQAQQLATKDAEIATNQEQTGAGKAASAIQNIKLGPLPIGKIIAPFTRIPSSIGVNGLWNYTPFGYGSQVYKQITSGVLDQRALSQAFGRSATGTSLAALGGLLAYNGLMTLKAPTDAKEKALWEQEGKQPNSIKIGNTWVSLNSLGPIGIVMGLGGGFGQALQSNPTDMVGAASRSLASGGKILLDQPYLKGISGVGNALNDPSRYAQSFFNNTAGSVIPAALQQTARGSDTVQRIYPASLAGKFQSEIPGLAQNIPAQHDLFGQTLPGANPSGTLPGAIAGIVNPFYPSQGKSNPVTSELQRLYSTLGSSASPNIGQQTANQTINGVKAKLDPAQLQTLIAQGGPVIQQRLASLIQDPTYQSLPDEAKANAINSVITATHKEVNGNINIGSPLTPAKGAKLGANIAQVQSPQGNLSISSGTKKFPIIDPTTGAVKTIDLSKALTPPVSTGNAELDKKLVTSYNSALTTRANDIVTLYKNGKIDAPTAEKYLEQLSNQKAGGTTKKGTKLSIKSSSPAKVAAFKSTPIALSKHTTKLGTSPSSSLRVAKVGKQPKLATARIAKAAKTAKSFKITSPRVYLSTAGSSQRGIRKAAGISVPTHKRKTPVLTI